MSCRTSLQHGGSWFGVTTAAEALALRSAGLPGGATPPARARTPGWGGELAVAFLGLWLAGTLVALSRHESRGTPSAAESASGEGDIVSVGDHAIGAPVSTQDPMPVEDGKRAVGGLLP